MHIFDEHDAELLAASNTPESLAQDAADTARRAARAAAYIEPVADPEPTVCDMCGDDLDDGECSFCNA